MPDEDMNDDGKEVLVTAVKGGSYGAGGKTPQTLPTHAGGSCRLSGTAGAGQEVEEAPPTSWLPDT